MLLQPGQQPTMEFNYAVKYVAKIKVLSFFSYYVCYQAAFFLLCLVDKKFASQQERFAQQSNVYTEFLEILHDYQVHTYISSGPHQLCRQSEIIHKDNWCRFVFFLFIRRCLKCVCRRYFKCALLLVHPNSD